MQDMAHGDVDVDGGKGEGVAETGQQPVYVAKEAGRAQGDAPMEEGEAGTGVLPSSVPGASDVDGGQGNKVVAAEAEQQQTGHGAAEGDRARGDAPMEEGEAGAGAEADTESDDCMEESKDTAASPSSPGSAPAAPPVVDKSVEPMEEGFVQKASHLQENSGRMLTPGRSVIIGKKIIVSPSRMDDISRARESVFAAIAGTTAGMGEKQAGEAGVSAAMEGEQGESQGKPAADEAAIVGEPAAAVGGKSDLKRPLPAQSSAGSSKIQKISLVQLKCGSYDIHRICGDQRESLGLKIPGNKADLYHDVAKMLVNPHKTEWQDWHFRTTLQDQKEGKAVLQDLVKASLLEPKIADTKYTYIAKTQARPPADKNFILGKQCSSSEITRHEDLSGKLADPGRTQLQQQQQQQRQQQPRAAQDPGQQSMQQWRQHPRPNTAKKVQSALASPTNGEDSHGAVVDLTGPPEREETSAVRSSNYVSRQAASSTTSTSSGSRQQTSHSVKTVHQYKDAVELLANGHKFLGRKLQESLSGKAWITEQEDQPLWLHPIVQGVTSMRTVLQKRIEKIVEIQKKTGQKVDMSKDESQLEACNGIMRSFEDVKLATLATSFCRKNVAQATQAWANDAGCPDKEIRLEMESRQLTFAEVELTEKLREFLSQELWQAFVPIT